MGWAELAGRIGQLNSRHKAEFHEAIKRWEAARAQMFDDCRAPVGSPDVYAQRPVDLPLPILPQRIDQHSYSADEELAILAAVHDAVLKRRIGPYDKTCQYAALVNLARLEVVDHDDQRVEIERILDHCWLHAESIQAEQQETLHAPDAKANGAFILRKDGDGYELVAFGERGHFGSLVGFRRLGMLLEKRGIGVPMRELIAEPGSGIEGVRDSRSEQDAWDEEALRKIYAEMKRLRAEIEDAQRRECQIELAEAEQKLEVLQAQVRKDTKLSGNARDINSTLGRWRASVHDSLQTVFSKLRSATPPMSKTASHLEASISSSGDSYIYQPGGNAPVWEVKL